MKLFDYDEVNATIATMQGLNAVVAVRRDDNDRMLFKIVSADDVGAHNAGQVCAMWQDGEEVYS